MTKAVVAPLIIMARRPFLLSDWSERSSALLGIAGRAIQALEACERANE